MTTKRKSKRRNISAQPLVSNPFDAAKRKKLALLHLGDRKKNIRHNNLENKETENEDKRTMPPPPKQRPPISRQNTFCSLPFETQTQEYLDCDDSNLSNHSNSNPSQTWLRFKSFDGSQSMEEYNNNNYLTPMDQPQTHSSQFDIVNNRIFNHTKSKIKPEQKNDENQYDHNNNNSNNGIQKIKTKTEYIPRTDLKIPAENEYLDNEEKIDVFVYKKEQKGIVSSERYNINYEEIELLGNGSFGKVYKVRNRNDGCFYAIKKIKIQSIHNIHTKHTKEKYMKEGFILSSLQRNGSICENILLYNSMWLSECGYFYLVTEYLDNGNLYNLYNLQFNDDILCKIIQNISNALLFIHGKGFVHFDVKPENILISKNGTFKLADFGLCTKITNDFNEEANLQNNNNNIPKVMEGDSRYLCRELIEESYVLSQLDKIDIFALGLSIYEMMIGNDLPSNGFKWQQIRNGNLSWNNAKITISNNMKQLIIAMIHTNPNERPSANQLNIFLRKFNDKLLQQKDEEIQNLRQKIKILMQQRHHRKQ